MSKWDKLLKTDNENGRIDQTFKELPFLTKDLKELPFRMSSFKYYSLII